MCLLCLRLHLSLLLLRAKRCQVFPADCLHQQIFTARNERVLLYTQMFQHLARLLVQISLHSPPFYIFLFSINWSDGRQVEDSAPPKLPATHGPPLVSPMGLDPAGFKSGISLTAP